MGDGQNPAAVVSIGFVEHFELVRSDAVDAGFDAQRPPHRIRQALTLVKEGARNSPSGRVGSPDLQHHQPTVRIGCQ